MIQVVRDLIHQKPSNHGSITVTVYIYIYMYIYTCTHFKVMQSFYYRQQYGHLLAPRWKLQLPQHLGAEDATVAVDLQEEDAVADLRQVPVKGPSLNVTRTLGL